MEYQKLFKVGGKQIEVAQLGFFLDCHDLSVSFVEYMCEIKWKAG